MKRLITFLTVLILSSSVFADLKNTATGDFVFSDKQDIRQLTITISVKENIGKITFQISEQGTNKKLCSLTADITLRPIKEQTRALKIEGDDKTTVGENREYCEKEGANDVSDITLMLVPDGLIRLDGERIPSEKEEMLFKKQ